MQLQTRPKLYPPMALLFAGPVPGPAPFPSADAAQDRRPTSNLSVNELRRILSEMLD